MAGISPDGVDPVLLFCDTFSHPENEVSVETLMPIPEVFSGTSITCKISVGTVNIRRVSLQIQSNILNVFRRLCVNTQC